MKLCPAELSCTVTGVGGQLLCKPQALPALGPGGLQPQNRALPAAADSRVGRMQVHVARESGAGPPRWVWKRQLGLGVVVLETVRAGWLEHLGLGCALNAGTALLLR